MCGGGGEGGIWCSTVVVRSKTQNILRMFSVWRGGGVWCNTVVRSKTEHITYVQCVEGGGRLHATWCSTGVKRS